MTGGRIKRVEKYIKDEPFMLNYGDGVGDINIPTLVNDLDVFKEITNNGDLAMLYETKNTMDLLNKINFIIHNFPKYKLKANACSVIAKEKYSIDRFIKLLGDIYSEVICY